MEGRLVHHAMEWLARFFAEHGRHANVDELRSRLHHYFRVLWGRGVRTRFSTKERTVDRVLTNIFPDDVLDSIVATVIEGARHTEYELRAVRKVLNPSAFGGKSRILLTGILDVVVQQQKPLVYERTWVWSNAAKLEGRVSNLVAVADEGDVEIWDYKGTRANTPHLADYIRQLLTYAALYRERTSVLPKRCVLFFINEPPVTRKRLLSVQVTDSVVQAAVDWTIEEVRILQQSLRRFVTDPKEVGAGEYELRAKPPGKRITTELRKQCTTCSMRFDCSDYRTFLSKKPDALADIDILNVFKN